MALSLDQSPKTYATQGSPTGVPLTDLEVLIGTTREVLRGSEVLTSAVLTSAASALEFRVSNHVQSYRMEASTFSGGVFTQVFNGIIDPLFITSLDSASVGDTLVQDGSNSQTGYFLSDPDSGARIADVLIGRRADNSLLLQANVASGALIDIFATEYNGGELSERLSRQAASPPHELRIRTISSTVPIVPENLTYADGVLLGLGTSGWVNDDRPLSGTGTEYYAFATATFNPLAGRWIIGQWQVVSADGGTLVQFAVSDTGPWHETKALTDTWMRWRDGNLRWHIEPLNELDDGWRFLTSYLWDNTASPAVGVYSVVTQALAFDVVLSEWKHLALTWEWGTSGEISQVILPINIVSTGVADGSLDLGVGRTAIFRRDGMGASWDDPDYNTSTGVSATKIMLHWQLNRVSAPSDAGTATLLSFDLENSSTHGTFRIYVGR